ncbi:MAG: hypothetical protein ACLR3R_11485 [Clostridium paraputrificum]
MARLKVLVLTSIVYINTIIDSAICFYSGHVMKKVEINRSQLFSSKANCF